jgi:hypothetical protein
MTHRGSRPATIIGTADLQTFVADFVTTAATLGAGATPALAAQALRERIQVLASQLGVTEAAALREHLSRDWGQKMARAWYRDLQERAAQLHAEPERDLAVAAAGRLIAALGQALLCFTVNGGGSARCAHFVTTPTGFSAIDASQAVSCLGLALAAADPQTTTVRVSGDVVLWAREALTAFTGNLEQRRWSSCPCAGLSEQEPIDNALLYAVRKDLRLLANRPASRE